MADSAQSEPPGDFCTATFGAGCFWCVEAAFQRLIGVESAVPGYMGGSVSDPTYEQVCSGETGHAEVVKVRFDADKIAYEDLLNLFWRIHDPTTLNRQGADVGTQYRSVIFYHNREQKEAAERSIGKLEATGNLKNPVITEVTPASEFFEAEPYHHDYYKRNPRAPYCRMVIAPKLNKSGLV